MADVAYLYVEDNDSGKQLEGWTGEEDQTFDGKQVKNFCRVQACDHSVSIPTHAQTGAAIGQAMHGAYNVTVDLDKFAPMAYQYLSQAKRVNVKIHFFRMGQSATASGQSDPKFSNWFTVTLTDARIVGLHLHKAMAMGGGNVPDMLDVQFRYYKIRWEEHEDKVEAEYEWKKKSA